MGTISTHEHMTDLARRLDRKSYNVEVKLEKLANALDNDPLMVEQCKAEARTALDELQALTRALAELEVLSVDN